MTAVSSEPPRASFRIEMLWTDARFRSTFFQVIAFILLMLGVGWLVDNAIRNLAALGKTFEFGFLFETAAYDINQTLIPYSSSSTHLRATIVGLLNTLLVAFMGCVTCTVIGVVVGVLRLSKNWLVRKLMLIYVEVARNVPVLLQILLWYAVFIETLPRPASFRDTVDADERSHLWFDLVAATNRGFYLPRPLFETGSAVLVGVFLASIVAMIGWGRWRAAYQARTGLEMPGWIEQASHGFAVLSGLTLAWLLFPDLDQGSGAMIPKLVLGLGLAAGLGYLLYVQSGLAVRLAILILPVVIAFPLMGGPIVWVYPELEGFNFNAGPGEAVYARNSLMALWLALSVYTGAFVAEIVRGGILSVPKGQSEAAAAVGLRPRRVMNLVILPQALRVIVPPQISQYLNLTKNSSLAIAVGYMDITGTLGGITLNQTGREMECILLLMAFYLAISLSISSVINWYNRRTALTER